MKIKFVFLLVPFIFSACMVFHSGNISSGPLMGINDQYAGIASGTARAFSILCFGDGKPGLIAEAKKNLLDTRKLNSDEYFSNFTVDIRKELIFGIVTITRATITADVMQSRNEPRTDARTASRINESIKGKKYFLLGTDTFRLGEMVYYTRNKSFYSKGTIDLINDGQITLFDEVKGTKKTLNVSRIILYSTFGSCKGFRPGDNIVIADFDPISNKKKKRMGVILGFNSSEVLVNTDHGHESQSYLVISKSSE